MFFVSRVKKNQNIGYLGQHAPVVPESGIISDSRVLVGEYAGLTRHPEALRQVVYHDIEKDETYTYLTNNFTLSAREIAHIYKARWQIELFFKWIKQHLKIKTFLGTSQNAVLTQIWIAMIYYLLLAYIKFQTKFGKTMLELTRMLSETLLVRRSLIDLLSLSSRTLYRLRPRDAPQPALFRV